MFELTKEVVKEQSVVETRGETDVANDGKDLLGNLKIGKIDGNLNVELS